MTEPDQPQPADPLDTPAASAAPRAGDTQPRLRPAPPAPPLAPAPIQVGGSVGGDVAGRDLHKTTTAGRDVVGGDVVTTTTTTHVGFSIGAVQRLVVTVGVLVFVTALCFFSSGFVLGGVALAALSRPVGTTAEAAANFQDKLLALQTLPAGERLTISFTEEEISSYFGRVVAPTLGGLNVTEGRVRLLDNGRLVIGGRADGLGGINFAALFVVQDEVGRPLDLTAAAVQVLPTRNTPFGWVLVPPAALGGLERSLNHLFGNVQILQVTPNPDGQGWTLLVIGH